VPYTVSFDNGCSASAASVDDPVQHTLGNLPGCAYRTFLPDASCVRCCAPELVCSHCNRVQVCCATGCSATARRQTQRDACRRYRDSLSGRFHHAARTRCWRVRQAALTTYTPMPAATKVSPSAAQSVTHQGSRSGASDDVLVIPQQRLHRRYTTSHAEPSPPAARPRRPCRHARSLAAPPPITLPTWRCHWCRTPCAARVRLPESDYVAAERVQVHAGKVP